MSRRFDNWLKAYLEFSSASEAPKRMHFWAGVSAIAGALRRKVWFSMGHFTWYPNFYVILVAPPGIVSKSTTAGIAMSLLEQVPDVKFGPNVVTWQALVKCFADSAIAIDYNGDYRTMSCLTISSSEFGNLFNPRDVEMVDLFVSLYDCLEGAFTKMTKGSGNDIVENPSLNLIACTTPSWIAGNFPEYLIEGGLVSRCIFVYAEKKEKLVAYPFQHMDFDVKGLGLKLIDDLTQISEMMGEYKMSPAALQWGNEWYEKHHDEIVANPNSQFANARARRQSQIHKLAMILAASESPRLVLEKEHLTLANEMLDDIEPDLQFVFSKIGRDEQSTNADKLINYVSVRRGCSLKEAYRHVHQYFPDFKAFEGILTGACRSGQLLLVTKDGEAWLQLPG